MDETLGNLVYTEFSDFRTNWYWDKPPLEYELFDIAKDEYQLTNIYDGAAPALKQRLHQMLDAAWRCTAVGLSRVLPSPPTPGPSLTPPPLLPQTSPRKTTTVHSRCI